MAGPTISILAQIRDGFSVPLKAFQGALGSLKAVVSDTGFEISKNLAGPIKDFRSDISNVQSAIGGLKAAASPITNSPLAQFATAFFSVETVRKALAEAKAAKEAEAQLLVSLNGDSDRFAQIERAAASVAANTAISQREMTSAAAALSARGVGFSALPEAMQLSADLAARLGISVQAAGEKIARVYSGQIPREIEYAIPALQSVRGEVDAGSKAIEILRQTVSGASEQFAQTDIGKIQKAQNDLNLAYQKFGEVLLHMESELLPSVTKTFQTFLDALSTPIGKDLVEGLTEFLKVLVPLIPYAVTFLGLMAAMRARAIALNIAMAIFGTTAADGTKTLGLLSAVLNILKNPLGAIGELLLKLGGLVSTLAAPFLAFGEGVAAVLGFIISPMGLLVVAIGAVVGGLVYLFAKSDEGKATFHAIGEVAEWVGQEFQSLWHAIKNVADLLSSGQLTIGDIGAAILLNLKSSEALIRRYIVGDIGDIFVDLKNSILGIFKEIELYAILSADVIRFGLSFAFNATIKSIADSVDGLTKKIASVSGILSYVPGLSGLANSIGPTHLADGLTGDASQGVKDDLAAALKAVNDFKSAQKSLGDTVSADLKKNALIGAGDIAAAQDQYDAHVKAATDRLKTLQTTADEALKRVRVQIAAQVGVLDEYAKKIDNYDTDRLRGPKAQLDLAVWKDLYDKRLVTVQEYLAKKSELEQFALQRELDDATKAVQRQQSARDSEAKTGGASPATVANLNEAEEKRLEIQLKLQEVQQKEKVSNEELLRQDRERNQQFENRLKLAELGSTGSLKDSAEAELLQFRVSQEKEIEDLRKQGYSTEEEVEKLHLTGAELAKKEAEARQMSLLLETQRLDYITKQREIQLKLAQQETTEAKTKLEDRFGEIDRSSVDPITASIQQGAALNDYITTSTAQIQGLANAVQQAKLDAADTSIVDNLQHQLDTAITAQRKTIEENRTDIQRAAEEIGKSLEGPLDHFFEGLAEHTKKVKDLFRDFLKDILKQVIDFTISQDVKFAMNKLGDLLGLNPAKPKDVTPDPNLKPTSTLPSSVGTANIQATTVNVSGGTGAGSTGSPTAPAGAAAAAGGTPAAAPAGAGGTPAAGGATPAAATTTTSSSSSDSGIGSAISGTADAGIADAAGIAGKAIAGGSSEGAGVAIGTAVASHAIGAAVPLAVKGITGLFSGNSSSGSTTTSAADGVGSDFFGNLTKSLGSTISGLMSSLKNVMGGIMSGLGGIVGSIAQGAGGAISGIAGGAASGVGNLVSGLFAALNDGGIVPGHRGADRDTVPTMLTTGEGVVRRTAVGYYGENLIHSLNRLTVPRHAVTGYSVAPPSITPGGGMNAGGIVGAGGGHTIHEVTVAPTEENFRRMVSGGQRALWDVMADHRYEARSALGIDG